MSSMFMLKDYPTTKDGQAITHKKGETVSVPFVTGRQWIAKGLARYLEEGEAERIAEEKPIVTVKAVETPAKPAKHETLAPESPMDAPGAKPDSHDKPKK